MSRRYDIAIVGAGMAGASLAYFIGTLGGGGKSVVLLEAEHAPGYHTTGRSAAFWEPTYGGAGVVPLSAASRAFFDAPPTGFTERPLLSPRGALHIAIPGDDTALSDLAADFARFGVATEPLDASAMAARYPIIGNGWERAGLFEPDCHDIDVAALHAGFLAGAKKTGTTLVCNARVEGLERVGAEEREHRSSASYSRHPRESGDPSPEGAREMGPRLRGDDGLKPEVEFNESTAHPSPRRRGDDGSKLEDRSRKSTASDSGGWRITTTNGEFTAAIVVDAAGAWGDALATLAGARPLGLTPLRRTLVVIDIDPAPPADLPVVFDAGGSFYFKPDAGRLWLSPHDEIADVARDAAPEELDIAVAIDRFERAASARVRRIERSWAGLRTFSPDRNPVFGFDPAVPGFFWCVGQGGFGIQTAPAAGDLAARLLLGLEPGPVSPAAYSPARFG